ncbi:hypothetical protein EBU71_06220 [bacterium]|nr:hypothetical protein [Candidatus Elulimicrobium humile]
MKTLAHTKGLGNDRGSTHPSNDLGELLAKVTTDDLRRLLESYGGSTKGGSKAYRCVLPSHQDSTPSLHVSTYKGRAKWKCFGCGASGDYLDLVEKVEGLSKRQAIEKLRDSLGVPFTASRSTTRTPRAPKRVEQPEPTRVLRVVTDDLKRLKEPDGRALLEHYVTARGWPLSTVERFGLAAVEYKGPRVLHPLYGYVNGKLELVSWQLRLDLREETTDDRPKYVSKAGALLTFYGLQTLERDDLEAVVLVEGPADYVTATLALEAVGADRWAVLGIVGAKSIAGLEPLVRGLEVVVAFDHDDNRTGDDAALKVVDALGRSVVRVRPPATDKDLTEAAKRLGLETVGEWLYRPHLEPATSRRVADEAELVAYVLSTFQGSYVVEEVAS